MTKPSRGLSAKDYDSVGTTYDGVRVLKPKTKPTSFTTAQIRAAVEIVLAQRGDLRTEATAETTKKKARAKGAVSAR